MRLFQGDYGRETAYSDDPVAVARRWEGLGAPRLHVVDLDGARKGQPLNNQLLASICRAVVVPVEVSGGIRTIDAIDRAFGYGASRVQLGSVAVSDPAMVARAVERYPGAIVVSIDARDGRVYTDGWRRESGESAFDLARRMVDLGVPRLMVTDISRDGAMAGPNVEAIGRFVEELPVPIVASGGVTSVEHLVALRDAGCEGAIVGRALYEGALDLAAAIEALARTTATQPRPPATSF